MWLVSPELDHLRIRPGAAQKALDRATHERLQEPDRIRPDRPGDGEKFKDIDTTFTPLVFGDEGLMHPEFFGELLLRETGLIARLDQQLAKSGLARRMDGFSDSARPRSHRLGRLIRTSDYPKTGYSLGAELCLDVYKRRGIMPITAGQVRYIKLGQGGEWEKISFERGEIHFGHGGVSHEIALAGDREQIKQHLVAQGRNEHAAIDDARELVDFYQLVSDCLWFTLAQGHLWWTFSAPEVTWLGSGEGHGKRMRKCIGEWRNTDTINNMPLRTESLSTRLTKIAGYRRAICAVDCEEYLLRRINGIVEPVVLKANQARETLVNIVAEAIGSLHWADFETMVDVIFARSGWHRISAVGGIQPLFDLVLEQPITAERAAVQVKSRAAQSQLNDFIARADEVGTFQRLVFVCHDPVGSLSIPMGRNDVQLWSGHELARTTLRLGLSDWIIEKVS